jgi:hypothetical protein
VGIAIRPQKPTEGAGVDRPRLRHPSCNLLEGRKIKLNTVMTDDSVKGVEILDGIVRVTKAKDFIGLDVFYNN